MHYILGVLNNLFLRLVRAQHKSQSGVSVLSFNFPILMSAALKFQHCEFLWFQTHTSLLVVSICCEVRTSWFTHVGCPTDINPCCRSVGRVV